MEQQINFSGQLRAVVTRGGVVVHDTGWFDNLILNQGLDRIGTTPTAAILYCHVGTSALAPANAQVGLDTFLAASATGGASTNVNSGSPLFKTEKTWAFAFAMGAVVGNIREVGVGWAASGTTLFSRALVVDDASQPASLTLVSADQLTVYYKLTCTPVLTDVVGSITLAGVPYNYTARIANVGSFCASPSLFVDPEFNIVGGNGTGLLLFYPSTSVLGAVTAVPTGVALANQTAAMVDAAYTAGNYYRDSTLTLGLALANASGGIGAMAIPFGGGGGENGTFAYYVQYAFATPIPKNNTKQLSLGFRLSWARA